MFHHHFGAIMQTHRRALLPYSQHLEFSSPSSLVFYESSIFHYGYKLLSRRANNGSPIIFMEGFVFFGCCFFIALVREKLLSWKENVQLFRATNFFFCFLLSTIFCFWIYIWFLCFKFWIGLSSHASFICACWKCLILCSFQIVLLHM